MPALTPFLSRAYRLEPGDLIYAGTPADVGAVVPGDEIMVSINGLTGTKVVVTPFAHD